MVHILKQRESLFDYSLLKNVFFFKSLLSSNIFILFLDPHTGNSYGVSDLTSTATQETHVSVEFLICCCF